jgi:hypothetical protein
MDAEQAFGRSKKRKQDDDGNYIDDKGQGGWRLRLG